MSAPDHLVAAVEAGLAGILVGSLDPPPEGRVGATLVLLRPEDDGDTSILYTRRQPTLSSHPGQISFPGGRVDPGEGIVEAALREAQEEVALDPATVRVLGRLPPFYIPPSRFWMVAVVALWEAPHDLVANEAEVDEVLHVPIGLLRDPERWRAVPLSVAGATWAWDLAPQRLLWGATAVVTAVLLQVADPSWSDGVQPEDLPVEQQVRPWEDAAAFGAQPAAGRARARLVDVPEEQVDLAAQGAPPVDEGALADDVIHALRHLARRPAGPVVVLAGAGRAGAVARMVVGELVGEGEDVVLLDLDDAPAPTVVDRVVRAAGVLVDGLADRSAPVPLDPPARAIVSGLSASGAPLIAIDLPSGIDPVRGVVGETVSADVTVAAAPLLAGHVAPGALPFVGDLYLSRAGRPMVRALPVGRPTAWAE